MKIFLTQASVFVILLLFTLSTKAQNRDYVITANGDTLACTITFPAFVQYGKYKTASMDKPKQILMGEIKELYLSKHNILIREVYKHPGKKWSAQFMTVLENGRINLYEEAINYTHMDAGGGMYTSSSNKWYVSKGSDTLKVIKNSDYSMSALFFKSKKSRKNDFVEMIMDNKAVYDKYLADDKFSFEQIRALVHLYNTGELPKDQPK